MISNDEIIIVCDNCFRASCWHGEFFCEQANLAGTTEKRVSELRKLKLEHESHWEQQIKVYGKGIETDRSVRG